MDLSRPWAIIRSTTDADVLAVLRGTSRPLTGREVARLVRKGSQPTVNASLRRLAAEGLVHASEAGNAYLYSLNREHLAAPAVEMLADLRSELERRIRAELARWTIAPVHASLFGSAARADGDAQSDIDLLVVRPAGVGQDDPEWRDQVEQLSDHVRDWTGNEVGLSELSEPDVKRLRRERPPVVAELLRDAIVLSGASASDLLASSE